MGKIDFKDRADEFRVSITGKFSVGSVHEVEGSWRTVLSEVHSRRFTVDISAMSGFDSAARKLLREMYHHGVVFAASTPLSLVFLNEIAAPRRRAVMIIPEILEEVPGEQQSKPVQRETEPKPILAVRAAGSGK